MLVVRKFAHSVMLALPRITAPASRSLVTRKASRGAMQSLRASEPALVCRRSAVAMLSLRKRGIPCSGPRLPLEARSRSSASAISRTSGLTSSTALSRGPLRSMASTRSRNRSVRRSEVSRPARKAAWSSAIVAPHGSPSRAVATPAILSHAALRSDPRGARATPQHFGASRSLASILSPGLMSCSVSRLAWNSWVVPLLSRIVTRPAV